jgi:FlgN protein
VNEESTRYLQLLEQRIALLNSLSEALTAAGSSMVAFDIDSLESRIGEQEQLCVGIRTLDEQIEGLQYRCAAHLRLRGTGVDEDRPTQLEDTLHRLGKAQARVKELNDAHQVLLQRSRRTIAALLNSLRTFEGNYQPTSMLQAKRRLEVREQV